MPNYGIRARARVNAMAEIIKKDFEGTTSNWIHQVEFFVTNVSEGDSLILNIYAAGDNADIYEYVDRGTEKRYAVMTPRFVQRTSPGSLRSGGGGDRRVAYFDFNKANAIQRAIQAREFSEEIVKLRRDDFIRLMRGIFND